MPEKQPVMLLVWIDAQHQRWFVVSLDGDGAVAPLICSTIGNLSPYVTAEGDEKLSFLRHRLSGVLQRGCDRVWARNQKPFQIVFIADGFLTQAPPDLTQQLADHMVEWLWKPPVVFYVCERSEPFELNRLAGELGESDRGILNNALPDLANALQHPDQWELVPDKTKQD